MLEGDNGKFRTNLLFFAIYIVVSGFFWNWAIGSGKFHSFIMKLPFLSFLGTFLMFLLFLCFVTKLSFRLIFFIWKCLLMFPFALFCKVLDLGYWTVSKV